MKPRVFLSSIMEGYSDFRLVAKDAITRGGGDPILIEDYPSVFTSPRNACLDGVHSCDILVLLIGLRGGFLAPSKKLVIEEEYEEALRKRMKVFVFIQEGDNDEPSRKFANKVSDYIDGHFRKTFSEVDELGKEIEKSLKPITEGWAGMEYDTSVVDNKLDDPFQINNETSLRFVIMPTRKGEMIDLVDIDTEDFKRNVYDIAHQKGVDLFSYEEAKADPNVEVEHVIYIQNSENRRKSLDVVRLEISISGVIVIDINVSGREKEDSARSVAFSVIHVDLLADCLRKCFGFCAHYFESKDPYKRFEPLAYNVCINGIGYKKIVDKYPQGGVSMGMSGKDREKAFNAPRIIYRNDIMNSEKEMKAVISMLKRRLKD
ncbi:DUF4062 domain-containing protein [Candidatus Omnitrophota bacterium]